MDIMIGIGGIVLIGLYFLLTNRNKNKSVIKQGIYNTILQKEGDNTSEIGRGNRNIVTQGNEKNLPLTVVLIAGIIMILLAIVNSKYALIKLSPSEMEIETKK